MGLFSRRTDALEREVSELRIAVNSHRWSIRVLQSQVRSAQLTLASFREHDVASRWKIEYSDGAYQIALEPATPPKPIKKAAR
jgi:hypothetical protein